VIGKQTKKDLWFAPKSGRSKTIMTFLKKYKTFMNSLKKELTNKLYAYIHIYMAGMSMSYSMYVKADVL
jgi:hypothetical protein